VTNRGNGELTNEPATDHAIGYKLAAGVAWRFSGSLSLFGEYRYTHVRAEPTLKGTITGADVPFRFDLDTHHLVAGLGYTF
jgi:opacity protein-like surface antigen